MLESINQAHQPNNEDDIRGRVAYKINKIRANPLLLEAYL